MVRTLIVGGGKIGYYLAKTLQEHGGYHLSVIEENKETGQMLANHLGIPVMIGDGSHIHVLEAAGVRNCETVIAVTGRDETNLVVCQLAKQVCKVKKTIAKVNNPKNIDTLKLLGVDIVISGTNSIIKQMEMEVDNSRLKELLPLNEGRASVIEITLPEKYPLAHRTIADIGLPEDCSIISITREKRVIIPRGKTKLMGGDVLLLLVMASGIQEVKRVLKIK